MRGLAITVCVAVGGMPAVAQADGGGVSCSQYSQTGTVPGSIVPSGLSLPYTIQGELCAAPAELRRGTTVQLLIPGGTYNHSYWDFGTIDGIQYSYARQLAAAGFPTFALDQIGTGQSSKPLSADVTNEVAAYVAHEAVQGLRDGSITGIQFSKVIEVAHSLGSATAWQEAISYQDVDGMIITGAVHHLSQVASAEFAQDIDSASQDPKFQDQQWAISDPGYLTTKPDTRAALFYNTADADPHVIAADDNGTLFSQETFGDEPGKDVLPSGMFDSAGLFSSTATQAIHVPVLVIVGSRDFISCGPDAQGPSYDCSSGDAVAREEAADYAPQAQLEACSVPNSGHDISLHFSFWVQEAAAISWSYHFVGQGGHTFGSGQLPAQCGWSG